MAAGPAVGVRGAGLPVAGMPRREAVHAGARRRRARERPRPWREAWHPRHRWRHHRRPARHHHAWWPEGWRGHHRRPAGRHHAGRPEGRRGSRHAGLPRRPQRNWREWRKIWQVVEALPEPRLVRVLVDRHRRKLQQYLVGMVRGIVVASASPALIAVAPPLLLEGRAAEALAVLDQPDELWCGEVPYLLDHHLLLLDHSLLVRHHLLVGLLLLLHGLKELPLLLVLDNFLPRLPVAWQDLFFFVDAKPDSLSLGKGYLHGSQVSLIRYEHALLVEVLNGMFGLLKRAHAHEGTSHATLRL
mmetsp:Transcript_30223/g.92847  ORF Transcript_30223/g.92847 Transcript_30223/m.92847 type:complete len:301 (-) Transcript_30223:428-1330(-)